MPRQNGKNAVIEMRELYGMAVLGERFLHTAHEVKTARKAFLRICSFFENERKYPELAALVTDIRKTNGQEAVLLKNGGGVEFIARSRGSGRGFTVDVLVCDEAQDLADEELAALLPTISASPLGNPQVILTGTPPDPMRPDRGLPWRRVRADGEADRDARLAWTDFGAADGVLPDVADNAAVESHNPSMAAGLLTFAEVDRERALMSPERFAAERMGWWGDPKAGGGTLPNWDSLSAETPDGSPDALGIASDPDGTWLSLGAAIVVGDRTHLGSVLHLSVARRAEFVAEVARISGQYGAPVLLDKSGPASFLIPDLEAASVPLELVGLDRFVQASVDLAAAVDNAEVEHGDYGDLNAAVAAAGWRKVGDRRVFARRNGDISSLEAVALALSGAKQATPDPDPAAYFV